VKGLRAWWDSAAVVRVRLSLRLLTERRAALFISIDALFLFAGLGMGLNGSGTVKDFWLPLFLMPLLVVGVPMLADTMAVERRSGTLDLALTSPGARYYFERRVSAVITVAILQGWAAMALVRVIMRSEPFPLSGPFVQTISVALFIGAVVLNWAVRVRTAGAVIFATYATSLAFTPWLFSNPIHPPTTMDGPMTVGDMIAWSQNNLVLLAAAATFYLYARQRLARPEAIIT
jgi:ABC-type Na+ efflux pump permease subunit